tara:strand:- start:2412 stop:2561 length:150 start_codon:yes stop_codon:yes gene_type:complete
MPQTLVVEDQINLLRSILRTMNESEFETEGSKTVIFDEVLDMKTRSLLL